MYGSVLIYKSGKQMDELRVAAELPNLGHARHEGREEGVDEAPCDL